MHDFVKKIFIFVYAVELVQQPIFPRYYRCFRKSGHIDTVIERTHHGDLPIDNDSKGNRIVGIYTEQS